MPAQAPDAGGPDSEARESSSLSMKAEALHNWQTPSPTPGPDSEALDSIAGKEPLRSMQPHSQLQWSAPRSANEYQANRTCIADRAETVRRPASCRKQHICGATEARTQSTGAVAGMRSAAPHWRSQWSESREDTECRRIAAR